MFSPRKLVTAGVLAVTAVVSAPAVAQASTPAAVVARPAPVCVPVAATGVGQDRFDGTTTATIFIGGVAVGTTVGQFTVTGVNGTVASFTGTITFRNALGTLVAPVTGTLDTASGDFASTSSTVTGTGAYREVTGSLTFTGHEDLTTGAFTETVTGTLCARRPHR
jgi:hypothetical protein